MIYIALLRGINVGGQKAVKMKDLIKIFESLNFNNASTYLQSGNIIFEYDTTDPAVLENQIEKALNTYYGFEIKVVVRTKNELEKIISGNPVLTIPGLDIDKLHITFLRDYQREANIPGNKESSRQSLEVLKPEQLEASSGGNPSTGLGTELRGITPGSSILPWLRGTLDKFIKEDNEIFVIKDREIYLYCPNGYGRTKLNNQTFERKLKTTATTRNWKTVQAILEIAKEKD